MNTALKSLLITLLIGSALTQVSAQQAAVNHTILNKYQDSLVLSASKMFEATSNVQRFDLNAKFIRLLVSALKTPSSFTYGFDSLKTISVVKSPDNAFRIFSWYIPTDEGTYRFFGTIQVATRDGALKLYPLIDATAEIKDSNQVTTNKTWYGARYYEIVPIVVSGRNTSYALLGWKGNNNKTSKKVIEILSFEKDEAKFGKSIFMGPTGVISSNNRIIFEYNKLNSMTLRMDKNEGMIVFDHLAPFAPDMEGNFEYYASDSSFDGYRLVGDKLKLTENLELKNDPNALDDFYVDPKLKNPPVTKKF